MKKLLILAAATPLLFASCAQQSLTGDTYSRGEAGRAQSVSTGEITSIRNVAIQGNSTAGAIIGGLAGGILGNEIGSGSTANNLGAVAGGAAGAALGSRAQQAMGTKQGLEITVKLDSGRSISAVQEINKRESFSIGERVRVLSNGSTTRITH
jgi:outer membrane lipoprotein SlyB